MKNLILLYRGKDGSDGITIKEFLQVKETNDHYLLGEGRYGNRLGVLKKKIGKICKDPSYGFSDAVRYPIELPYMKTTGWDDIYFIFVNKSKYDENPVMYYDMIKNYREG